ncbi:MAG: glycerol-3-phosphate acyltransferase [Verrucomicrobiota bacterium]|nr:glycerol-3-phosphate acyltransferase [Limisphaera sp.]MDW8381906.1 glycerol-3-phosphate acyltransferase [Verrucomicrobiota bacterium]
MSWLESWLQEPGDLARAFLVVLGSYFIGCVAGGYYLVRWTTGRDIRFVGSGSAGARNVSSVLGIRGFLVTLVWDALKGALAVWVAARCTGDSRMEGLAMVAALAGHLWPAQLGFRGGKGVATSLGSLLMFEPELLLALALLFLPPWILLRRTILPGMVAYACLPFAAWFLDHGGYRSGVVAVCSMLVLYAHRRNLAEEWAALSARRRPPAMNSEKA